MSHMGEEMIKVLNKNEEMTIKINKIVQMAALQAKKEVFKELEENFDLASMFSFGKYAEFKKIHLEDALKE